MVLSRDIYMYNTILKYILISIQVLRQLRKLKWDDPEVSNKTTNDFV